MIYTGERTQNFQSWIFESFIQGYEQIERYVFDCSGEKYAIDDKHLNNRKGFDVALPLRYIVQNDIG